MQYLTYYTPNRQLQRVNFRQKDIMYWRSILGDCPWPVNFALAEFIVHCGRITFLGLHPPHRIYPALVAKPVNSQKSSGNLIQLASAEVDFKTEG